jgi:hypothetical protein
MDANAWTSMVIGHLGILGCTGAWTKPRLKPLAVSQQYSDIFSRASLGGATLPERSDVILVLELQMIHHVGIALGRVLFVDLAAQEAASLRQIC